MQNLLTIVFYIMSDDEPGEEEVLPPIQLFSRDVNKYTGDVLTQLLPRIIMVLILCLCTFPMKENKKKLYMMMIILQAERVFIMKKIDLIGFLMIFLSWHPCTVVVRPTNSCDIIKFTC